MVKKDPKTTRAIGFDLDGTLLDSLDLTMDAFWQSLKDTPQFTLTQDELFNRLGPPEPVLFKMLLQDDKIAKKALTDYSNYFCAHLNQVSILPQIPKMLAALKNQKITLALVTGRSRPLTEVLIKHFDLEKYFSITITGSELQHYKPHPEGMQKLLATLSLTGSEVLFCGDTNADIVQAKETGITAGLVKWYWGSRKYEITAKPDVVFESPEELLQLLDDKSKKS